MELNGKDYTIQTVMLLTILVLFFLQYVLCKKSEESMDPRDPFFSAACGTDRSCGMCAVTGRRLYGFSYAGSAFMRNLRDHLSGADPDCAICLSKKTQ